MAPGIDGNGSGSLPPPGGGGGANGPDRSVVLNRLMSAESLQDVGFAPSTNQGTLPPKKEKPDFSQFGPAHLASALDTDVEALNAKRETLFHAQILDKLAGLAKPNGLQITLSTETAPHGLLTLKATQGRLHLDEAQSEAHIFDIEQTHDREVLAHDLVGRLFAEEGLTPSGDIKLALHASTQTQFQIVTTSKDMGAFAAVVGGSISQVFQVSLSDDGTRATIARESISGAFDVSKAIRSVH